MRQPQCLIERAESNEASVSPIHHVPLASPIERKANAIFLVRPSEQGVSMLGGRVRELFGGDRIRSGSVNGKVVRSTGQTLTIRFSTSLDAEAELPQRYALFHSASIANISLDAAWCRLVSL